MIDEAIPELQPAMIKRLESIRQSVTEVLPKLAGVAEETGLVQRWYTQDGSRNHGRLANHSAPRAADTAPLLRKRSQRYGYSSCMAIMLAVAAP